MDLSLILMVAIPLITRRPDHQLDFFPLVTLSWLAMRFRDVWKHQLQGPFLLFSMSFSKDSLPQLYGSDAACLNSAVAQIIL